MGTAANAQFLIAGYFHCDGCGRTDAERIIRYHGRRLCAPCVERIVPSADPLRGGDGQARTDAERAEVAAFWGWLHTSQSARPARYSPPRRAGEPARPADECYPLCDCGRPREAARFSRRAGGLFGGPFLKECVICRMRREVSQTVESTAWLHPEWDDEEWLDLLYKVMPAAFELRVLPDYWYDLRRESTVGKRIERMGD